MYYWSWDEQKALMFEIKKWETRTEWAQTDETVALAIEQHKQELMNYPLYNLGIILEIAFDRIAICVCDDKEIPWEYIAGNEKIYDISCIGWYAYIEI